MLTDRASERPRPPRVRWIDRAVAAAIVVAIAGFGVTWLSSRSRGKALSQSLYQASVELDECMRLVRGEASTLRDAVERRPADATPLASCAAITSRVAADVRGLTDLRLPRDREGIGGLTAITGELTEDRFRERADGLAKGPVDTIESQASALLKQACRIAIGEGSRALGSCPPAPTPPVSRALPVPRVVLDTSVEFLLAASLELAAEPNGSLRVHLGTVERDHEHFGVHLGSSSDAGKTFHFVSGRVGSVDGTTSPPVVSLSDGRPRVVLSTLRDEHGAFKRAVVARVSASPPGLETPAEVPALPEGLEPLRAGTPVWLDARGQPERAVVAVGPRDPSKTGGALIQLLADGKHVVLPTPAGALVAAAASPKPRVVVLEQGNAGGSLAVYDVPDAKQPWPTPQRLLLPPGELRTELASELYCGMANERWFPFVARQSTKSFMVVLGEQHFALKFDPPQPDLARVCGLCPPSLLARSDEELSLLLPIGNQLTRFPVGAPLLVTLDRRARRSVATCLGDTVLVAHVTRDQIWIQRTGIGGTGPASLLVLPNEHGAPIDVRVAASEGKLYLLWRREQRMKLRVEMLASSDGGITWE